ncbi:hypothetical protein EYR40_004540 [Pleurotus pulmonarius]|nr:hypothetical protein EYR40_004540 [Pleurotus pulmonarius]
MSRYPLRNRQSATAAKNPTMLPNPDASARSLSRSYSDVVAVRVPSGYQEPMDASRGPPFPGGFEEMSSAVQGDDMAKEGQHAAAKGEESTQEGHHSAEEGEENTVDGGKDPAFNNIDDTQGWTQVNRRKNHSRDRSTPSLRRHVSLDDNYFNNIRSAYVSLNNEERETLRRREAALASQKGKPKAPRSPSPPVAGPSQSKGKAIDLGNLNRQEQARLLAYWNIRKARERTPGTGGNAVPLPETPPDRESSEMRRRLEALETENRILRENRERPPSQAGDRKRKRKSSKKKKNLKKKGKKRASSQLLPSNQVPGKSLLSRAFAETDDDESDSSDSSYHSSGSEGSSSSSSSSSSTSSSSSSSPSSSKDSDGSSTDSSSDRASRVSSDESQSDSRSSSDDERRRRHRRHRSHRNRSRSRSRGRNGRTRHRDRNERRKRRHKERKPLLRPTPPTKYNGEPDLFAYTRFVTESDLVKEFASAMQQKLDVVSTIGRQERVSKLWKGFHPHIQASLIKDRLNSNTSSWKEVVEQAQIIEVANATLQAHRSKHGKANEQGDSGDRRRTRNGNRATRYRDDRRDNRGAPRSLPRGQTPRRPSDNKALKPYGDRPTFPSQLSTAERDALRRAGKCYICKGEGHGFKDCPKSTTIRSSGANKPPGFPSHGIGIDFEAHEAYVEEVQEPLHELDLSAIRLTDVAEYADVSEPLEHLEGDDKELEKRSEGPLSNNLDWLWPLKPEAPSWEREWYNPRDPYAVAQGALLNKIGMTVPFPADDQYPKEKRPVDRERFAVRRGVDDEYIVVDRWQNYREVRIAGSFLKRPNYNILQWYAVSCCAHHGLRLPEARTYKTVPLVEDHLAEAAEYHLTKCAPYVGDGEYSRAELDNRFGVWRDESERDIYHIWDEHRHLQTQIPRAHLTNHAFNFPRWYNTMLYRREREFVQRLENAEDNWNLPSLFPLDSEYCPPGNDDDDESTGGPTRNLSVPAA